MLNRSHFNRLFIALPLIQPDIGVRDKYESLTPDLISGTQSWRMHFLSWSSEVGRKPVHCACHKARELCAGAALATADDRNGTANRFSREMSMSPLPYYTGHVYLNNEVLLNKIK